jgi:UDP-2-acetamido-3-amino-2,3-dideoxy-glucuronate N-acetyltransferase
MSDNGYYAHPSAVIDAGCDIGAGTKIWHFCHVMKGARIGRRCNLGQNVFIDRDVPIGDNVKIQNNVSVYTGVAVGDHCFLGPSCVFTNVTTPRSAFPRTDPAVDYVATELKTGASVGANATIRCGVTLGEWCVIGSGAVVTKDVLPHAVLAGVPARQLGWACLCGDMLQQRSSDNRWVCRDERCRREYTIDINKVSLAHTPEGARPMVELD